MSPVESVSPESEQASEAAAEPGCLVSASLDAVEVLRAGDVEAWAEFVGAPWTAGAAATAEAMGDRAVATMEAAVARARAEGAVFKSSVEDRDWMGDVLWEVGHKPTDGKALAEFVGSLYLMAMYADAATARKRLWRSAASVKTLLPRVSVRGRRRSVGGRVRVQSRRVRRRAAARASPGRSSRSSDDPLDLPGGAAVRGCRALAETRGACRRRCEGRR